MEDSDDEAIKNEQNIGYFSTLNLNYFATDEDIKKNFNELYERYSNKHDKELLNFEKKEGCSPTKKKKLASINPKELMEKIYISYSVLEDRFSRSGYLHMLEIRYFLSQPTSVDSCKEKYSGRMFPFSIFEVMKKSKNGNSFSPRLLKIDFVTRSIVEFNSDKIIKGINFQSIQGCQNSHKNDEFLLSICENNSNIVYLYKTKFLIHRDLIVQITLLAKDFNEKRSMNYSTLKNPNENYFHEESTRSPLSRIKNSSLKLVINDRYIPPKSLFKVVVFEKVSFPGFNRKFYMILGHCSLILSKDDEAKIIERIIPIENGYVSLIKNKDNDSVTLNLPEEKINLKFLSDEDCTKFNEYFVQILNHKIKPEETLISLPYLSKDVLVSKIKTDKLKKIIHKIEEATILLEHLKNKKVIIEEEILQEEQNLKNHNTNEDDVEGGKEEEKKTSNDSLVQPNNPNKENSSEIPEIIEEDTVEIFKRTSRKIKTIYMKSKKLI